MPSTELRRLLNELESTVSTLDPQDANARDRLSQLAAAVESQLQSPNEAGAAPLIDDIQSTVSEFENEHPVATGLLNNIATTLSAMGI